MYFGWGFCHTDMVSVCFVCAVVSVCFVFVFVLVCVSLVFIFVIGLSVLSFGGRSCNVTLMPSYLLVFLSIPELILGRNVRPDVNVAISFFPRFLN